MIRSGLIFSTLLCSGFVAAHFGKARALGGSLLLLGAGLMLYSRAPGYAGLTLALALAGVGGGVIEALLNPLVEELHREDSGRYLNIVNGFYVPQKNLRQLIGFSAGTGIVISLIFPLLAPGWSLWLLFFLGGVSTACFWPSIQSLAVHRLNLDATALLILLSCGGIAGFSFASWAVGLIGESYGLARAFALTPLMLCGLLVLLICSSAVKGSGTTRPERGQSKISRTDPGTHKRPQLKILFQNQYPFACLCCRGGSSTETFRESNPGHHFFREFSAAQCPFQDHFSIKVLDETFAALHAHHPILTVDEAAGTGGRAALMRIQPDIQIHSISGKRQAVP